jgi:uncharacterized RDD family membrane protein YckC
MSQDGRVEPASLGRRFGALFVDWIVSLILTRTFTDPLRHGWAPVLILILLYGLGVGLVAQTLGMWVMRIRCVRVTDGRPVGVPRALLRGVLLALVVPALVMDGDRRGLHDRAAGTIVLGQPATDAR